MKRRPLSWYEVKEFISDVGHVVVLTCALVIVIALAVAFVGGAIHIWRDLL